MAADETGEAGRKPGPKTARRRFPWLNDHPGKPVALALVAAIAASLVAGVVFLPIDAFLSGLSERNGAIGTAAAWTAAVWAAAIIGVLLIAVFYIAARNSAGALLRDLAGVDLETEAAKALPDHAALFAMSASVAAAALLALAAAIAGEGPAGAAALSVLAIAALVAAFWSGRQAVISYGTLDKAKIEERPPPGPGEDEAKIVVLALSDPTPRSHARRDDATCAKEVRDGYATALAMTFEAWAKSLTANGGQLSSIENVMTGKSRDRILADARKRCTQAGDAPVCIPDATSYEWRDFQDSPWPFLVGLIRGRWDCETNFVMLPSHETKGYAAPGDDPWSNAFRRILVAVFGANDVEERVSFLDPANFSNPVDIATKLEGAIKVAEEKPSTPHVVLDVTGGNALCSIVMPAFAFNRGAQRRWLSYSERTGADVFDVKHREFEASALINRPLAEALNS